MTRGRLPRNILYNFALQAWLAIIHLLFIPYILHNLGAERYGIFYLTIFLSWSLMFLNFGVAQGMVKFVAERSEGGNREELLAICRNGISLSLLFGLGGAILTWLLAPLLAFSILNITPKLRWEAFWVLGIAGFGFFSNISWSSFAAMVRGYQRFDWVFGIHGAMVTIQVILIVCGMMMHLPLPALSILYVAGSFVAWIGFAIAAWKLVPDLGWPFRWEKTVIRKLLRFGGWWSIALLAGEVMVILDKIILGNLLSVAEMGLYLIAAGIAMRLPTISHAIQQAFIPTAAQMATLASPEGFRGLFHRALRAGAIVLLPVVLVLVFMGGPLLRGWIGRSSAESITGPLIILSIAFFINAMSFFYVAISIAQEKLKRFAATSSLNAIVYLVLAIFLIPRLGLLGAATAFLICQVVIIGPWMASLHREIAGNFIPLLFPRIMRITILAAIFGYSVSFASRFVGDLNFVGLLGIAVSFILVFYGLGFFFVLDEVDREKLFNAIGMNR